jgi:hypothetical protein
MLRVKSKWTGFNGAPGYTNFYFRDFSAGNEPTQAQADGAVARTSTFWANVKSRFPTNVTVQVQGDVEVVEETTGEMKSVFSVTPPVAHVGSATSSIYSGPVGAVINWRTDGVRNGRRVRGRTFLVPIANENFAVDGTLDNTKQASILSAAVALADSTGTPDLGVWARPTSPGATDGAWWLVKAATVPDMAAVLRSRRD